MNLFVLPLCHGELDAKTDDIADDDLGQHGQKAVEEHAPECGILQLTCGKGILIAHIVHAEEQRRNKRYDDERHDALAVDGIVDVCADTARRGVGHEGKRLEAIIKRTEGMQLATFLEVRLYLVEVFS